MATEKITDTHQPAPADQAALADIQKQLEAGGDPFGDNDDSTTDTSAAGNGNDGNDGGDGQGGDAGGDAGATGDANNGAGDGTQQGQGDQQQGDATKNQPTAEQLEEAANIGQEQPAALPKFKAELPENFEEQRKTLRKEKAEAFKKYNDGEITDDAYAEIVDRVDTELENLTALRIRTETLQEVNVQTAQASQQAVIASIINTAKASGELDYIATPAAQKQFDIALTMAMQDPDNAAKSYADLANAAHRTVLALRGITAKQPTDTQQTTQQAKPGERKPTETPPVTLSGIPSASTSNTGGDVLTQLSSLHGQDFESAFSKLPPAQQARLLDE